MPKIALVVGHTERNQGALSYNGRREWEWNKKVADEILIYMSKAYPKFMVKTFYRPDMLYRASVQEVGRQIGEFKADISLELHFNSIGHEIDAFGCEVLINQNAREFDDNFYAADKLSDALAREFSLKQRAKDGVVILKEGKRGYYNIKYPLDYGTKIALLVEPMFAGTKTHESEQFFETEVGIARYAQAIGDYLGKGKWRR